MFKGVQGYDRERRVGVKVYHRNAGSTKVHIQGLYHGDSFVSMHPFNYYLSVCVVYYREVWIWITVFLG